ncbi:MAG: protein kinase [Acidobacteria bacterium]|nr:protein kinase [Acidobacteriota bacterium]
MYLHDSVFETVADIAREQMTPEKWTKVKDLLSQVQNLPVEQRPEFLAGACDGDEELRKEVENLLDSYHENDSFLEESAVAEIADFLNEQLSTDRPETGVFQPGQLLNRRYEIIRQLGKGGMGEVFLAHDNRINRRVTVKVLPADFAANRERLRRFRREAAAVSALNHPNIMTVYEFDRTDDGIQFIVGEFIDGQTLGEYRSREQLTVGQVLEIAVQAASALSAAHEVGIVHRDIKPENMMIRRDGYLKVLDFGLAKLTKQAPKSSDPEDPTRELNSTNPGAIMGTAAYMSPEQSRGTDIDHRTDLWSLGVVVYELLTGQKPFSGETPADILVSVVRDEPPPLGSYLEDIPPEIEWVISKTLSKKPEGRYQTAGELRADFEKIKKRLEFDARPPRLTGGFRKVNGSNPVAGEAVSTFGDQAVPTDAGAGADTDEKISRADSKTEGGSPKGRKHNLIPVIAGLALISLIVGALYYFLWAKTKNERIDSIAVLPFENLSRDQDLADLADGLSENLIDRLSGLPELRVISKNSSFRFRDSGEDIQIIASKLGVRAIVTGSTMQVGDELIVRFEIVDTADNRHLLGGRYQLKAADLLKIQNEIPQAISDQLNLKLTAGQSKRIGAGGTENPEAFRYYLNGLVELNGPDNILGKSLQYFEKAVELDPNFAEARVEIAWIYWSRANASGNPGQLMPKVREETEKALALDPGLAKALVMRATLREFDFDWPAAEQEYQKAIEQNPNLDFARRNYAFFLSATGRHDEALVQLDQLSDRDPINMSQLLTTRGIILAWARRFDDALREFQKAQAIDRNYKVEDFSLGYVYGGKGLDREAAGHFKTAVELVGGDDKYSLPLVFLAASYAKIPDKQKEARMILSRLERMDGYVSPATLAIVYAALGDRDRAVAALEKAYLEKDLQLRFVGVGYEYDDLRADPRFADLLKRMGLPQ